MRHRIITFFSMLTFIFLLATHNSPIYAESADNISLPTFNITLNQQSIENSHLPYPLVVYKDITYVPMTWDFSRLLGLSLSFDTSSGLTLTQTDADANYEITLNETTTAFNNLSAVIVNYPVSINGNAIDNATQTYPILNINGITYFPLTWAFAHDAFNWDYRFDIETGLEITPTSSSTNEDSSDETNQASSNTISENNTDSETTASTSDVKAVQNEMPLLKARMLPSAYSVFDDYGDTVKASFLRDQGNDNTCWAFASNSLFELAILVKDGITIDFSEDHLIKHTPIPATYDSGGNFYMASGYYTSGYGPILESEDPYDDGKTNEKAEPQYLLTDYLELHDDIDATKQAIYKYGGALTSIALDETSIDFYNRHNNSYYNNDDTSVVTHDVVLVGWDDDYEAYHFEETPSRDGAFIALNSWGEDWGDAGLFYISYDDVHILENVNVITGYIDTSSIDNIYNYTPTGVTHFEGYTDYNYATGMNRFTSSIGERLYAVSFYTSTDNTKYEVSIDVYDDDTLNLMTVASGVIANAGYHTIEIPSPPLLVNFSDFYCALMLSNDTTNYLIPVEAPYPDITYEITGNADESFITLDPNKYDFTDLTEHRENGNIAIRAFTVQN